MSEISAQSASHNSGKKRMGFYVTTPTNEFIGIYGLSTDGNRSGALYNCATV
ncbi:MAG: hypothetical protein PHF80_02645 [Methanothrix sp.]|nr:hypothetical protein [Methanothrix sp.]